MRAGRFLALLTAVLVLCASATGEGTLRGYTAGEGYVYLRLGRYPQTAEGGIEPILWRVLASDEEQAFLFDGGAGLFQNEF